MTYLRSSATPSVVPKQVTDKLLSFVDVTRPKGQVSCDRFLCAWMHCGSEAYTGVFAF